MGGLGILLEDLITTYKPCYIILPLYVYECLFILSKQLKRRKEPCIGWYDKLQNLLAINGNSTQRKTELIATLIFYSSMKFVFETAFISEQIVENKFGALLEICDKFITKFNVFSYMILQFRLSQFGKFQNHTVWL